MALYIYVNAYAYVYVCVYVDVYVYARGGCLYIYIYIHTYLSHGPSFAKARFKQRPGKRTKNCSGCPATWSITAPPQISRPPLMLHYPEGPSTQYVRTLVPKAVKDMVFGTRVLKD